MNWMRSLRRGPLLWIFPLLLLWAGSAWALSLHQAKAQGLVGEQPNGYLGVVAGHDTPAARSLVQSINAKRRQVYQEIARRNGTALHNVEVLAGKKAIERTPAGEYVRLPSGGWHRK